MSELVELERRLGVEFGDRGHLKRALVHRSFAFEHDLEETNERLEFLGDAVLALVVTDVIYRALPEAAEGVLAKLRAAAVKTDELADVARAVGLGDFIRLGKGETATGGADKDSILADALEAVLGAVYVDRGHDVASLVVRTLFQDRLAELATRGASLDYKTSLQELAAARFDELPTYDLVEEGPDHEKSFIATVELAGETWGRGTGGSKKKAEQAAAREAYRRLAGADVERREEK
ncbi:MAG: ribonuclease III [Nitriliruptorales bacterium]